MARGGPFWPYWHGHSAEVLCDHVGGPLWHASPHHHQQEGAIHLKDMVRVVSEAGDPAHLHHGLPPPSSVQQVWKSPLHHPQGALMPRQPHHPWMGQIGYMWEGVMPPSHWQTSTATPQVGAGTWQQGSSRWVREWRSSAGTTWSLTWVACTLRLRSYLAMGGWGRPPWLPLLQLLRLQSQKALWSRPGVQTKEPGRILVVQ